jgi:O-methyltransferase
LLFRKRELYPNRNWQALKLSKNLPAINVLRRAHRRYVGQFRSEMRFPTFPPLVRQEVRHSADPVRYATLGLAVERLKSDGLKGDLAELGVWRGDTSRFLHLCAPERILHLFDTFSGFPKGLTEDNPDRFNETSVEFVKKRIGDLRNIAFHVGYFPSTTAGLETEDFALVMLDADCYQSTLSGLQFFYPRTVAGGYIFLHDFNSPESAHGVGKAVAEFMADKPERIVEIPDTWGSAFFRKVG